MRPALRAYVAAVVAAALALGVRDLLSVASWPHEWQPYRVLLLLILCVLATNFTFLWHGGWYTAAGTVPQIATAFLLPPGLAEVVAAIGALTRVMSVRMSWQRAAFNTAKTAATVGAAAHVATYFGGPDLLAPVGDRPALLGPGIAMLMIAVYYVLDVSLVARAAAWDQRRSFWQLARARSGLKVVTDLALGLLGAAFGVFFLSAPLWTPALLFPGVLVFFGKKTMDSAERRSRQLALTSRVGRAVAGTLDPAKAIAAIVDSGVMEDLKLDGLALTPVSDPPAFLPNIVTKSDKESLRTTLAEQAARTGERVVLPGEARRTFMAAWLDNVHHTADTTAAAIPFHAGGEQPIGVLVAWREPQRSNERSFTAEELLVLETLADYATVTLETAQLAEEMGRLNRLAAQADAKREALRQSEERFRSLVQNASDVIAIVSAEGTIEYLSPAASQVWGYEPQTLIGTPAMALIHPEQQASARVHFQNALAKPGLNVTTELRLLHSDGTWRDFEVLATNMLEQPAIGGVVATYRDITQRKEFDRELQRLAFRDALTDLPNRALFRDRLQRALTHAERHGRRVAVLFLDLDRFKIVNDSLGHQVGDALLIAVADRLKECVRAEDTVSRLGGDEFTVLLEDVVDEFDAIEAAERIAETLRTPLALGGHELFVSASIGIALNRSSVDDTDSLLRNADLALYRAKASGKARYAVFDPSLETSALARLELEMDLRHALDRQSFCLEYQPVVRLDTNRMVGVEALVRWDRPGYGPVSPAEFVPIAEETGLIVPLGEWVLVEACRQLREWQQDGVAPQNFVMNVNLSGRQFQSPLLDAEITRILQSTGLNPHSLKLEITESVVMQDAESAVAKLQALKKLGVQLAIDDFGTGYSSLSYLKRFPVDTLKIDRSFVGGIAIDGQDSAIVASVIALAKSLGLTVTGEGVETPAQAAFLRTLGCDRGQGFWFALPLPACDVRDLLERESAEPTTRAA